MSSPSKACLTKNYSHSKLVLKWNNIAPTSIPSSAHLQSLPGMVQFLETYSDDDDMVMMVMVMMMMVMMMSLLVDYNIHSR